MPKRSKMKKHITASRKRAKTRKVPGRRGGGGSRPVEFLSNKEDTFRNDDALRLYNQMRFVPPNPSAVPSQLCDSHPEIEVVAQIFAHAGLVSRSDTRWEKLYKNSFNPNTRLNLVAFKPKYKVSCGSKYTVKALEDEIKTLVTKTRDLNKGNLNKEFDMPVWLLNKMTKRHDESTKYVAEHNLINKNLLQLSKLNKAIFGFRKDYGNERSKKTNKIYTALDEFLSTDENWKFAPDKVIIRIHSIRSYCDGVHSISEDLQFGGKIWLEGAAIDLIRVMQVIDSSVRAHLGSNATTRTMEINLIDANCSTPSVENDSASGTVISSDSDL